MKTLNIPVYSIPAIFCVRLTSPLSYVDDVINKMAYKNVDVTLVLSMLLQLNDYQVDQKAELRMSC